MFADHLLVGRAIAAVDIVVCDAAIDHWISGPRSRRTREVCDADLRSAGARSPTPGISRSIINSGMPHLLKLSVFDVFAPLSPSVLRAQARVLFERWHSGLERRKIALVVCSTRLIETGRKLGAKSLGALIFQTITIVNCRQPAAFSFLASIGHMRRSTMATNRSGRSKRGFAAMDPAKQREIASKGGRRKKPRGGRKSSSAR